MSKFEEVNDKDLESQSQQAMRRVIKALPEEEVNLVWRSELNAKIQGLAKPARKPIWRWALMPATGLACAVAVVAFFMMPQNPPSNMTPVTKEDSSLLQAHREGSMLADFGMVTVVDEPAPTPTIEFADLDKIPL